MHSHSFHVNRSHVHLKWSNALKPILTVDSGAEVSFDLLDGGHNQLTDKSTIEDLKNFNIALADPAIGPVYVKNAEPGDVLKIEFLTLETAPYGWTAIMNNFGLLSDEFTEPQLRIWDLTNKTYTAFKEGIHIPIRPFLGVVGLAHAEAGEFSTIPPYVTGGNIDTKHITVGSALYLPVKVPGALFSCGDGHAAQGDGEVCGTAIETPMKATVRLTVEKGKPWVQSPHYLTNPVDVLKVESKGEYAAVGIHSDLMEATKMAVRSLIDWLVGEKGLTRVEAYMLASVAADLKITEVVDKPNFAVACALPLSVFV